MRYLSPVVYIDNAFLLTSFQLSLLLHFWQKETKKKDEHNDFGFFRRLASFAFRSSSSSFSFGFGLCSLCPLSLFSSSSSSHRFLHIVFILRNASSSWRLRHSAASRRRWKSRCPCSKWFSCLGDRDQGSRGFKQKSQDILE